MINILYDIINIMPLAMLTVIFFGKYTGMPENSISGYIISAVVSLAMIILRNMKSRNRLRFIGIATVFSVVTALLLKEEQREFIINGYYWIIPLVCLLSLSLITGIFSERTIWVKRIVSLLLLAYCILSMIYENDMKGYTFSLICFVIAVYIAEETQRRWKKECNISLKEHVTEISPILIALCIAVCVFPKSDMPYDWQTAKDIYNKAVIYINRLSGYITRHSEEYGNIGFSDSGEFLARIKSDDEKVLIISSDRRNISNLRLTGLVGKEFDGRRWIFDTDKNSNDIMLDTIETASAVRKYDMGHNYDYIRKTNLYFETRLFNTRYMFAPIKTRSDISEKGKDINGSMMSDKRMGYGDEYSFSYYMQNYGNPVFFEMLINAEPLTEEEWYENTVIEGVSEKEGYSFDDYLYYRNSVYEEYLETDGVSDEVAEIISGIENNSENRYEMMKNLEAYLSDMEYSTESGSLPDYVSDGKSYLDYFLLESKKGYCMHYATAFVLIAREMGVPCRYVQGYCVSSDNNGNITVMQNNAHAWPEVYFDNAGWIPFEPTPGYSVYSGWQTLGSGGINMIIPEVPSYNNDIIENDDDFVSEKNDNEKFSVDMKFIIIPVIAVAVFLVLFFIISRCLWRRKYSKMGYDEKFIYLVKENMRLLRYLGFGIRTGETLSEYKKRLLRSEKYDFKENLMFISYYEEIRYSYREISEKEVVETEKVYGMLKGYVKKTGVRYRIRFIFMK